MATVELLPWLLTYALHSTLLLGAAWLVQRVVRGSSSPWLETMWRCALILPIVSSLLVQLARAPEAISAPVGSVESSGLWTATTPEANGAVQTQIRSSAAPSLVSVAPEAAPMQPWRLELTTATQRGLLSLWLAGAALGVAGLAACRA